MKFLKEEEGAGRSKRDPKERARELERKLIKMCRECAAPTCKGSALCLRASRLWRKMDAMALARRGEYRHEEF